MSAEAGPSGHARIKAKAPLPSGPPQFAPAPSSTSLDETAPPHVFHAPEQVKSDLAAARDRSTTKEQWQEATESSLEWLLSLRPLSVPVVAVENGNGKGKEKEPDFVHWFCGKEGAEECWESAVFLLRLMAFKTEGEVAEWRRQLDEILHSCCDCVRLYQKAKSQFLDNYLRLLYPEKQALKFKEMLNKREYDSVKIGLESAGLVSELESSLATLEVNLSNPRRAIVYNCLANPFLLEQLEILDLLVSGLPSPPLHFPPALTPGALALILHDDLRLREWAYTILTTSSRASPDEYRDYQLGRIIDAHLDIIVSRDRGDPEAEKQLKINYTSDRMTFWKGVAKCLASLSPETIYKNLVRRGSSTDIVSLVVAHLGDQGRHVGAVLAALRTLLQALGPKFWNSGDDKYEEVVLHAILDNTWFEQVLAELANGGISEPEELLDWLAPFVASVSRSPQLFVNSIAIILNKFLNSFQHDRFDTSLRTMAIELAVSTLGDIFVNSNRTLNFPHRTAVAHLLDLHAQFLTRVAFSNDFIIDTRMKEASSLAAAFVERLTLTESKGLAQNILALGEFGQSLIENEERNKKKERDTPGGSQSPAPLPSPPPSVTISKGIWRNSYASLRADDQRGLGILLKAVAASSQFEKLTSTTWSFKEHVRVQMKAANDAMDFMRPNLLEHLTSYAEDHNEHLLRFLEQPGVGENISTLLFSPVSEVHNAALHVVKNAFDVLDRRAAFRALLFQVPDACLRGLIHAVKGFIKTAELLPTATEMAKRLVQCMWDVIDSLCGTTDGLLRDSTFLNRSQDANVPSKLLSLWKLMSEALALLFKKTPAWSTFFENEEMTEWMRDALMFGIYMLEQVRTFELVVSGKSLAGTTSTTSPSKTSRTGTTIIAALNAPLDEVLAWLRLTDVDLLARSITLVCKMLDRFSRSEVPLLPSTVAKIRKIVEKERKRGKSDGPRSSIISDDQLRLLDDALDGSTHTEEDSPPSKTFSTSSKSTKATKFRSSSSTIEILELDSESEDDLPKRPKGAKSSPPFKPFSQTLPVQSKLKSSRNHALTAPPPSLPSKATRPLSNKQPSIHTLKPSSAAQPARAPVPRPRGVPWTTYSSKTATIIDSSSSSDDSDDDARGKGKLSGLAALALAHTKAPTIKQVERKGIKILQPQITDSRGFRGTPEATKVRENAERLRSVQDYSNLHRQILQWDYTFDGPLPPSMKIEPAHVPSTFTTADDYIKTYEPLLLVECWEQIRQAREEAATESKPIPADIAGRQDVDDFLDIFLTIEHGKLPDRFYLSESDLVLLRQGQRRTLARVTALNRKREFVEISLRCHLGNDTTNAGPGLVARTRWEIVKLYTTIHREYSALQGLRYLELCPQILRPRPPPRLELDPRTIARAVKAYQVNEPQARAILGSLTTPGFSLIQGPPGTGKTKTILGLIGAFIDSRPRAATSIQVGRPTTSEGKAPVAKVLLCAPSNAAVDEVAKRIMGGIRDSSGEVFTPKVVRIGSDSAVDVTVKEIFIDQLVERALNSESSNKENATGAQDKMQILRAEVDSLRADRDAKSAELAALSHNDAKKIELAGELKMIKSKIFSKSQELDSQRDKAQQAKRSMDAQQRKVRLQILSEADVICSTLSGSGHDYMSQLPFDFETVIIDEAAQSIELSSLIPLKYGCKRCILVGDPLQLPPTVISRAASKAGYDRSLFVRMMGTGPQSVHLLSIQYRMHPHISAFPSAAFYDRRLTDGPSMDVKTKQDWHKSPLFPPYAFMHVNGGEEVAGRHHSLSNPREAATALAIYERLTADFPTIDFAQRIGVVTPYKGQVGELRKQFRNKFGFAITERISFATVDGFQGQEKDIIILSCVRGGSAQKSVGFLSDTRRMNVALTRARSSLFVLGDMNKLKSNEYWGSLVADASERGLLTQVRAHPVPLAFDVLECLSTFFLTGGCFHVHIWYQRSSPFSQSDRGHCKQIGCETHLDRPDRTFCRPTSYSTRSQETTV
ncbi:hypothetical protein T439DRAFT_286412 [Meredithblackwellia eburnea MCA 4105]